jgi:nicotinamide-nucleotide adenylyltransferase
MKKYKTGLFIARFQPFHLGHLSAIKQSLKICEKIVFVIGSSNQNFSLDNPLTKQERYQILQKVIDKQKLSKFVKKIILFDDYFNHIVWMEELIKKAPEFDLVISNNNLISTLADYKKYDYFQPKFDERQKNQGKIIRSKMINGQNWQSLVPECEIKILKKVGLEKRLKMLSGKF